jgi:hypothetical protein
MKPPVPRNKDLLVQRIDHHYAVIAKVDKNLAQAMKSLLPSLEREPKADYPLTDNELKLIKGLIVALYRRVQMSRTDAEIRTKNGSKLSHT